MRLGNKSNRIVSSCHSALLEIIFMSFNKD